MSTLRQHVEPLLNEDDLKDRNVKVRINTYIDFDILKLLKKEAHKKKIGYQTLLNQKMRELVLGKKSLEKRVTRIEHQLRLVK